MPPGSFQSGHKTMKLINTALISLALTAALPGMGQAGRPILTPATPAAAAPPAPSPSPMPPPAGSQSSSGSATAPASATPAPIVGADYVIGPEDQLQVTVWENPALSGSVLVRPDGNISLPLIGDVTAAGLTPLRLAASITDRLKNGFVKDPTVNVAVLAVNSKQVIMIGEVGHVGPIAIRPGMTVLQAIVTAGGLTPFANKKKIYVLRGEPGKQQRIKFDYKKSLLNDDMLVEPGDRIVVPE